MAVSTSTKVESDDEILYQYLPAAAQPKPNDNKFKQKNDINDIGKTVHLENYDDFLRKAWVELSSLSSLLNAKIEPGEPQYAAKYDAAIYYLIRSATFIELYCRHYRKHNDNKNITMGAFSSGDIYKLRNILIHNIYKINKENLYNEVIKIFVLPSRDEFRQISGFNKVLKLFEVLSKSEIIKSQEKFYMKYDDKEVSKMYGKVLGSIINISSQIETSKTSNKIRVIDKLHMFEYSAAALKSKIIELYEVKQLFKEPRKIQLDVVSEIQFKNFKTVLAEFNSNKDFEKLKQFIMVNINIKINIKNQYQQAAIDFFMLLVIKNSIELNKIFSKNYGTVINFV